MSEREVSAGLRSCPPAEAWFPAEPEEDSVPDSSAADRSGQELAALDVGSAKARRAAAECLRRGVYPWLRSLFQ